MNQKDFIFTGLQSWDIPIGSNAIDIAKEMSRKNRILYVNSPLDIMTLFRNKPTPENKRRFSVIHKKTAPLRKINDNLWVLDLPFVIASVNGLPDGKIFDFINRKNNKKIFSYVNKIATELGFSHPIHFIDNDIYRSFYAKEYLKPSLSVYYRRDNLQPFPYWKKHVARLEPMLIAKSDVVVCNSPQLANFAKKFNPKSTDIGQGVDLSAYDAKFAYQIPGALKNIPTPRIGYIGDINSKRLDADLLFDLAVSRPTYSFIMVGGEDELFRNHKIHNLKNVHFTGSIPKNAVPQYMAALQVCLNPQLLNEITIGNYPRKVDEYLAMGKPVIATATDTMQIFKEHAYLCNGLKEYQEAIDDALHSDNELRRNQRIQFAGTHSWENNVSNIYQALETYQNN